MKVFKLGTICVLIAIWTSCAVKKEVQDINIESVAKKISYNPDVKLEFIEKSESYNKDEVLMNKYLEIVIQITKAYENGDRVKVDSLNKEAFIFTRDNKLKNFEEFSKSIQDRLMEIGRKYQDAIMKEVDSM